MSKRGVDFLEGWIAGNLRPQAAVAQPGDARPKVLAEQCAADAGVAGISVSEIEEDVGDLEVRMANAINTLGPRPA